MPVNIRLILNVLLLIGVMIALVCLMRARRQAKTDTAVSAASQPSLGAADAKICDDIIAVRKIIVDADPEANKPAAATAKEVSSDKSVKPGETLMLFLVAKEDRQLAGYELLQTLLACGLRFGEGNLFHRHEHLNGQGAVLCSLAAATSSGMFDLQNIGAFSVKGLCLFMQVSGNPGIDEERLSGLFNTANLLSEGLDARLLNDQKQHFTQETISRYHRLLNLTTAEV
jgi:cell division protein ZipA